MRQLNINGPLYVGLWSSLLFQSIAIILFTSTCPIYVNLLGNFESLSLQWHSSLTESVQAGGGRAPNSLFLCPWRRHEGNLPAHQPAVQRRPGGLRVPLHALHRLPLSAGGGRRRRQKHQHVLQLDSSRGRSSAGVTCRTCWYDQPAPRNLEQTEKRVFLVLTFRADMVDVEKNKKHKYWQKRSSLASLWRTFLFMGTIPIVSLARFFFFYCKSSFDHWKNGVIPGMKSRHSFLNLT